MTVVLLVSWFVLLVASYMGAEFVLRKTDRF